MIRHPRPSFPIESLEARCLLSAVEPTALEQYAVELINRGRADPTAEASRDGVLLNEGLNGQVISTAAKQPLAINPFLTDGARKHSQWMRENNTFAHTGSGGSSPDQRMTAAGYTFAGRWGWGENIVWQSYNTASPTAALVEQMHRNLFVDTFEADRGHRINMMSPNFREIGAGLASGPFQGWPAAGVLTTDFGTTAGNPFLTGVAYEDTVVSDHFYTPGEGLAGVTITATRATDHQVFSTHTFDSGGYSLALPAGTYRVTATGGSLAQPLAFGDVTIASLNVKADVIPGTTPVDTGTPPPADPPPVAPPPVIPPPGGGGGGGGGGTPGGGIDATPPSAELTQALRQRSATRYYSFAVTYADDRGVDPATFDDLDVFVTGPGGYVRNANFDHADATAPGTPRTATYVVKGPGGGWDAGDNGVYTITLRGRQVRDASGNPASPTVLGAFSTRIPGPAVTPPPTGGSTGGGVDVTSPTAELTQAVRQRSATRYYAFVVTYTDDQGVDPSTFDDLDVFVMGPLGYVRNANFDHADAMTPGTPRAATYIVKGPGGSWDVSDNGVYTITLRRRQVRDTSGNPAGATVLGAFSARVPAAAAAAAVSRAVPAPAPVMLSAIERRKDETPVFA